MDDKNVRTEPALSERSSDGNAYASSGSIFPCTDKIKSYHDVGSNALAKVDVQTTRPCAVIGPDRIVPQPQLQLAADPYVKHGLVEPWQFPCPPEQHKLPEYQHQLTRNISPRQTFQENMPRVMVPPVRYNPAKVIEDQTFTTDKISSTSKDITKLNIPSEAKYCDVPYTVTPLTNEHKSVRNTELPVSNVDPMFVRSAPHSWSHSGVNVRSSRGYGPSELYHYPEYSSCSAPRLAPMNRMHRPGQEEILPIHPDTYYRGGNIRFEPYPSAKERYQPPRYDYITNYANPYNPTHFPSHKCDLQKLPSPALPPHPYPGYPQVPLKYLEKMRDPLRDGYQRSPTQSNYGVPYHNQGIHPNYGSIPGNCLQNKPYTYPTDSSAHADPHTKSPYETNKAYMQSKHYPTPNNYFLNELPGSHHMKPQMVMPNYPALNMHPVPPYPYYRKENMPYKNYDFPTQYKNADPMYNTQLQRIPSQFSPNVISPVESNTSNDHAFSVSPEDCGYVSQSSTTSIRSTDSVMNRYRVYDPRYGHMIRGSPLASRIDSESKTQATKDKKNIDLRQFLQSWNEGDDEHGDGNANKETAHQNSSDSKRYEVLNNQEQLYVLGLVNVPSEELDKYEHIQKVSKLPDNIKGYTSIELLNQFEEAIESTKMSNNYSSRIAEVAQPPIKANSHLPSNRPLSPLDVEAKISQSVIHKEVGCNFELRLCSPKMMNVEEASPAQNVLGERAIEKMANPLIAKSPSVMPNIEENCSIVKRQNRRRSQNREEAPSIPSCKMIKTQYSVDTSIENKKSDYSIQDLESNSGVCLASLPRLDNEIELSFPEVNQQFINANKFESTTSVPHNNLPSLEINDNGSVSSRHTNPKKDRNGNPFSPSQEFSKLSKYRKFKTNKESTDPQVQKPQPVRTDSVIIKNPENSENISMVEDEVEHDQCNQRLAPTPKPMNLTMHSPLSGSTHLGDLIEIKSPSLATLKLAQTFDIKTSPENLTPGTNIAKHPEDPAADITKDNTKDDVETLDETNSLLDTNNKLFKSSAHCELRVNDSKLEADDEIFSLEQERRRQSLSLEAQLTPMSEDTYSDGSDTDSDNGAHLDAISIKTAIDETVTTQSTSETLLNLVETKKEYEVSDSKDNTFIEQLSTAGNNKLQSTREDHLRAVEKAEGCALLVTKKIKSPDTSNKNSRKFLSQKKSTECEHILDFSTSANSELINTDESLSENIAQCEAVHEICQESEQTFNVLQSAELNSADESINSLSESKIKVSESSNEMCQQSELAESDKTLDVFTEKVKSDKSDEIISSNMESEVKDNLVVSNQTQTRQQSSEVMEPEPTSNISTSDTINEKTECHRCDHESDDSDSDSSSDSETSSSESTSEAEQYFNPDSEIIDLNGRTSPYSLKNDRMTILDSHLSDDFKSSPAYVNEEKQLSSAETSQRLDPCSVENITVESGLNMDSRKLGVHNMVIINNTETLCVNESKPSPLDDTSASDETVKADNFRERELYCSGSTELNLSLANQSDNSNCENAIDVCTHSLTDNVNYKQSIDLKHKGCHARSIFFYKELFSAAFQHLILEEGLCARIPMCKPEKKYDDDNEEPTFEPKKTDQKSPTDLVEERLEKMHASDTSLQGSSEQTEEDIEKIDFHESDSVHETDQDKIKACIHKDSILIGNNKNAKIIPIASTESEDIVSSVSQPSHDDIDVMKHSENENAIVVLCKPENSSTVNIPNDVSQEENQSKPKTRKDILDLTQSKDNNFLISKSSCDSDKNISDAHMSEESEQNVQCVPVPSTKNENVLQADGNILENSSSYKSEDIAQPLSRTKKSQEYPHNNSQTVVQLPIDTDNSLRSNIETGSSLEPENFSTPVAQTSIIKDEPCVPSQIKPDNESSESNSEDLSVLKKPVPTIYDQAENHPCQPVVELCVTNDNAPQREMKTICSREPELENIDTSLTATDNYEKQPGEQCQSKPHDTDSNTNLINAVINSQPVIQLNHDNETQCEVETSCAREPDKISPLLTSTDNFKEEPREQCQSKSHDTDSGTILISDGNNCQPVKELNHDNETQCEVETSCAREPDKISPHLTSTDNFKEEPREQCQSKPHDTDSGTILISDVNNCQPVIELNHDNETQCELETSCAREPDKISPRLTSTDNFKEEPREQCQSKPHDTDSGTILISDGNNCQPVIELNFDNETQAEVETSCAREPENISSPLTLTDNFEEKPRDHCQSKPDDIGMDSNFEDEGNLKRSVTYAAKDSNCQPEEELIFDNDNTTQCKLETNRSNRLENISMSGNFEEHSKPDNTPSLKQVEEGGVFERSVTEKAENFDDLPLRTNLSQGKCCYSCQTESDTKNLCVKKCCLKKDQRRIVRNFHLTNSRGYLRTTKRSLSESAISCDNHILDKENMTSEELCWSKRRKKTETTEDISSPVFTSENLSSLMQSRRNSVSSFYRDENVSFCILIDNDCIIAQEDFDQEAICFADIPEENFGTVVDNHILANNEIDEEPKTSTTLNHNIMGELVPLSAETIEEKSVEESWVEDVACVETVVSEDVEEESNDIYEDMTETSPTYEDTTYDSDKSDLDMFSTNDHADKIKHIYGNEMCSSQSIDLIKTLYITPQMDVNKALHHTESFVVESSNRIDSMVTVSSTPTMLYGESVSDRKIEDTHTGSSPEPTDFVKVVGDNNCLLINDSNLSEINAGNLMREESAFCEMKELAITTAPKLPDGTSKTQDEIAQQFESSNDEVFYAKQADDHPQYKGFSSSPEVSSTTEEKKSGILLKITNYNGSRMSHIDDVDVDSNRRIRCKFTEENDYRSNLASPRPLITKAAQKYIPPLKETTTNNLKVKLFLPEHSLLKLKQIKMSKEQPKIDSQKQNNAKNNFKISQMVTNKKPKPKFEDVLKSIDEIQIKMHKEKSKKIDKTIPKVIIKKNGNGSHYASSSAREVFNPDMTGRKWQPWVFLEKYKFIDKMALSGKTKAVYCHRKKTYILAENFKKYRSIGSTKFFISKPKSNSNPAAPLKYTIKLKQVYEA